MSCLRGGGKVELFMDFVRNWIVMIFASFLASCRSRVEERNRGGELHRRLPSAQRENRFPLFSLNLSHQSKRRRKQS